MTWSRHTSMWKILLIMKVQGFYLLVMQWVITQGMFDL